MTNYKEILKHNKTVKRIHPFESRWVQMSRPFGISNFKLTPKRLRFRGRQWCVCVCVCVHMWDGTKVIPVRTSLNDSLHTVRTSVDDPLQTVQIRVSINSVLLFHKVYWDTTIVIQLPCVLCWLFSRFTRWFLR